MEFPSFFLSLYYKTKTMDNLKYKVEICQLKKGVDASKYKDFLFKDLGYLVLHWTNKKSNNVWNWHGFVSVNELKQIIGLKQYEKFCQGKRIFNKE